MTEVPIGGDFFGNPYLAKQFAQLQRRYTERLLAGIKAWKEISYQVIDPEKALKYCPEEYDRIEDAAALSKRFVEFMDGQMEKEHDISSKDLRGDFKTFGDSRDSRRMLAESESAVQARHNPEATTFTAGEKLEVNISKITLFFPKRRG